MKAACGHIWKHTVGKRQTNTISVTFHHIRHLIRGHIWKRTVERIRKKRKVQLCIISDRRFKETFKNTQGRKVKHMQYMWLCIVSGRQFNAHLKFHTDLRTYLKAQSGKKSNKCDQCDFASSGADDLRPQQWSLKHMQLLWFFVSLAGNLSCIWKFRLICGHILKRTVEKSQTNVNSVTLHLLEHTIWGLI